MLDRLERAGELKRVPAAGDRRKTLIRLTEKDRNMRDTYDRVSIEMTDLYYAGFRQAEIDAFEGALARILTNLERAERLGTENRK